MSQALITLFRTAFTGKVAVKAPASAVRAVSAVELRRVVGGAGETQSPRTGW